VKSTAELTQPCGAPTFVVNAEERVLFTFTLCTLLVKKHAYQ
jgi:hypothetical protein